MKLQYLKIGFGFALLLMLAGLIVTIALGEVTKEQSYGLEIPLGCLTTLAGAWSQWAFSKVTKQDKEATK